MKLGVLSYGVPHLKTQQLLAHWALDRDISLILYGLPFKLRPKRNPLLHHRPNMDTAGHPREVARAYGIPYRAIADVEDIVEDLDAAVVAGAGLLPARFVERVPVVNGHPGLIPAVRGLDAFKWAIYDRMPLGVSLHVINAEVDGGQHLKSECTPVYADDTPESLAQRHYETEIALLAAFRRYIECPEEPLAGLAERPPRKRMPVDVERDMLVGFREYVEHSAVGEETGAA